MNRTEAAPVPVGRARSWLAVLLAGVALGLFLGFLELVEFLFADTGEVPDATLTLWRLVPHLGMSIGVFFLFYLLFWAVFVAPAGRLTGRPFVPLAAFATIFVGLFLSLVILTHQVIIPHRLADSVYILLIAGLAFLPAAACARALDRRPDAHAGLWRRAAGWGLAGPLVLLEFLVFTWLWRGSLGGAAASAYLALLGLVVVALLSAWAALRAPRPLQVSLPLMMFLGILLAAAVPRSRFENAPAAARYSASRNHGIGRVILISIDTLPATAVSCYDPQGAATPNIDRLADDAVLFRQALSAAPWTLPAFSSMMTGLSPSVHRATRWDSRLPDAFPTLAESLRDHGYVTAAIGWNPFLAHGLSRGFLQYCFYPKKRWKSFGFRQFQKLFPRRFKGWVSTDDLTSRAIAWLDSNQDKDFFFWLHYYDPHIPYTPPARYLPATPPPPSMGPRFNALQKIQTGEFVPTAAEKDWIHQLYQGEVRYVDDNIGQLLDHVKRLGIYDDALIILTSDHGEEFWEHDGFEHGHTLYNELLRVPLLVKLPRSVQRGEVSAFVSTQSLAATVLDLCGIQPPDDDPMSASLTPCWKRADAPAPAQPLFSSGALYYANRISLVDGERKYIYWPTNSRWEVYDLRQDPGEQHNLPFASAEDEKRVSGILEAHLAASERLRARFNVAAEGEKMDRTDVDLLRSLGYL